MLIFMQAFHNFIHTYDKSSFYMLVIGQVHFTYCITDGWPRAIFHVAKRDRLSSNDSLHPFIYLAI